MNGIGVSNEKQALQKKIKTRHHGVYFSASTGVPDVPGGGSSRDLSSSKQSPTESSFLPLNAPKW